MGSLPPGADDLTIRGVVQGELPVINGWSAKPHRFAAIFIALLTIGGLLAASESAAAEPRANVDETGSARSMVIRGDRLSGFVLPIEPLAADVSMSALRASAWQVDDTQRLILEDNVRINIGSYSWTADRASVWLNRIPSRDGVINQIAVYFDEARSPTMQAGVGAEGDELLVTGSTRGEVLLSVSLKQDRSPQTDEFVAEAEQRLKQHLQRLAGGEVTLTARPRQEGPPAPPEYVPRPGGTPPEVPDPDLPERIVLPEPDGANWLARPDSTLRFSADKVEFESGETENVITIIGSLVIEYTSSNPQQEWSQLTMTAERAVIFTRPMPIEQMASRQFRGDSVLGVYLEGNVLATAEQGKYLVRSPRVYYDFQTNQAIMLESLLRTYARSNSRIPVNARAEEMRQISANQWKAKRIAVSASEFHTPHLAIGAQQMTVTQRPAQEDPEETETHLESRKTSLLASGVPIFAWPNFSGNVEDVPLKSVDLGSRDNDGLRMLTTWDLFVLSGKQAPEGVDADLKLDGFTKRGVGTGLDIRYSLGDAVGRVDLYGLFDEGTDRTSSGRDVEPESKWRGIGTWENTTELSRYWTFQGQLSLISDPTFVTSWREDDFLERREYESSLYLKHQRHNAALDFLTKYAFNDFLSNDYLLASRQYTVDKMPELTYRRYGDSLFGDRFTYSTENRVSHMRLAFARQTSRELGVREGAFGIDPDEQISDALRAQGYRSNYVSRVDTRHELAMPMHWGIVNVAPFIVGRVTAYDDDFEEFSSDADDMRFFGSAGVRLSTRFQRVDNSIENELLDLHRVRHIVEPYATLWTGYSDVEQENLPEYDTEVESLATGSAARLGLRNTWQTQRGGPGRWRSVDVLTLDTSLVLGGDDADPESPMAQFFDYRPEYSQFGDHLDLAMIWLLSDSLSLLGEGIYDLDQSNFARASIGTELRHSPVLVTYVEYRVIEASNNQLLEIGWNYQLSSKYAINVTPQYDFQEDDFRAFRFRVTRSFPDFDFTVQVRYDQIRDDTSLGASIGVVEF